MEGQQSGGINTSSITDLVPTTKMSGASVVSCIFVGNRELKSDMKKEWSNVVPRQNTYSDIFLT